MTEWAAELLPWAWHRDAEIDLRRDEEMTDRPPKFESEEQARASEAAGRRDDEWSAGRSAVRFMLFFAAVVVDLFVSVLLRACVSFDGCTHTSHFVSHAKLVVGLMSVVALAGAVVTWVTGRRAECAPFLGLAALGLISWAVLAT